MMLLRCRSGGSRGAGGGGGGGDRRWIAGGRRIIGKSRLLVLDELQELRRTVVQAGACDRVTQKVGEKRQRLLVKVVVKVVGEPVLEQHQYAQPHWHARLKGRGARLVGERNAERRERRRHPVAHDQLLEHL